MKRVAVIGIGAVGGYYGGRLAYHSDHQVIFVARGATLERLRQRPLRVKSIHGDFQVKVPVYEKVPSDFAPDLIIITTKSYDTLSTIPQFQDAVTEQTRILCIQNGIENEIRLQQAGFSGRVLGGVAFIGSYVEEPGIVVHQSVGGLAIGAFEEENIPIAREWVDIFSQCQIKTQYCENIRYYKWRKLLWNAAFNSLTTLTGRTVIELLEDKEIYRLIEEIMNEIIPIAQREGVPLTERDRETMIQASYDVGDYKTSMVRDFEKGKITENEDICGSVVRFARKHSLPVPINKTLYLLVKQLELQNRHDE